MRHITAATLALLIASAPVIAQAQESQEVYSWRDAAGVVHYSQTPPGGGIPYETHKANVARNAAAAATTATSAEPAAAPAAAAEPAADTSVASNQQSQCELARKNVEALKGEGVVRQRGPDGQPRELSASERADQLNLSEAAVRAYCR